jgi:hypothetical protein
VTWTRNTTSGTLTHAGIYRSAWHCDGLRAPTSGRITLQSKSYGDHVRVVCPCSTDDRTGWEVGIMGDGFAAKTNLTIRRIVMGVPEAPTQQVAHGIGLGVTFTLQVDYTDNTITASMVGAGTTVTLSHTNTVEPTFTTFRSVAVASDIDGATVDRLTVSELVRDSATIRDALVAVGDDGSVYASFDGSSMTPIASRVLGQTGQASIGQYLGTLYAVGGGKARKVDLVNRVTTPWTATSGSLPGASGAGTTDAQVVAFWGSRALLARSQANPNGLYASAIDDPDDFNTGSSIYGAAFVLNLPEPIVALLPVTDQQLIVCCERSAHLVLGDPGLGASEVIPILGSTGASGPTAVLPVQSPGGPLIHSPEGVYLVRQNTAVNITKNILTQYAEIDRDDIGVNTVSVVRDPQNARVHIFITPTTSSTQGTHLVYEEAVGGFDPNGGGWFLDTFPATFGPTAAAIHKGRMYLGGHDGVIRLLDVEAEDDDGQDMDVKLPVRVIHKGLTEGGVHLERTAPQLTTDTTGSVTVTLYAGATAQQVMDVDERTELWSTTYAQLAPPIIRTGADTALLLEFSSTGATWAMQQVDVVATPFMGLGRRVRVAVTASAPCTYPVVDGGTSPPGGGTGPGAPGGGVVGPVALAEEWIWYDGFEFIRSPISFASNGTVEIAFRDPLDDGLSGGRDSTNPPPGDPFEMVDKSQGGFSRTNPWIPGVNENLTDGGDGYMDYTAPPTEE